MVLYAIDLKTSWTAKREKEDSKTLTAFSFMRKCHSSVSETRVQIKSTTVHICFLVVSAYRFIRQGTAAWALARLGPILPEHTFGAK